MFRLLVEDRQYEPFLVFDVTTRVSVAVVGTYTVVGDGVGSVLTTSLVVV